MYRCRFSGLEEDFALFDDRFYGGDWRIFVLPCLKLHHFFSPEHKM